MRRPIVPAAIVLALVTGAFVAETRMALEPAAIPREEFQDDANLALVRQWYEAIDELLRTGDATEFDEVVGTDLVDHTALGAAPTGRDWLRRYVSGLRQTFPGLRVRVVDLTAQDDRVVARVRVEAATGSFLGVPVAADRVWSAIDVFRIAAGRIVEHWGEGGEPALFDPEISAPITLSGDARGALTLEQRIYAPGGGEQVTVSDPFTLFVVNEGGLHVVIDQQSAAPGVALRRSETGAAEREERVPPGTTVSLAAGDGIILTGGAGATLSNPGATEAVAIVVIATTDRPGTDARPPRAVDGSGVAGVGQSWLVSAIAQGGGPWVELAAGASSIAVGRLTLAPAAGLLSHEVAGIELIGVVSGALALTTGDGQAWIRRNGHRASTLTDFAFLGTGDGALVRTGPDVRYRNAGDDPVGLILVIIAPATGNTNDADSSTSSPGSSSSAADIDD